MSARTLKKKSLTEIEMQAITIWELIFRIQRKYEYSIPQTALRTVRKASRKFIKNATGTKYDINDKWNVPYLDNIRRHLKEKDDMDTVYLTWIQFQFHSFIHRFCPEHDPDIKENRQPFYDRVIGELTH